MKLIVHKITASALLVRRDNIFCTRCFTIEPIHPGESGVPINTYLVALELAAERHPDSPHKKPEYTR